MTIDITGVSSPDENTAIAPDSPCSPAETSASAPSKEQEQEQQQQQIYDHHSQFQQQQQRTTGSAPAAAPHVAEDSGAPVRCGGHHRKIKSIDREPGSLEARRG